MLGDRRKEQMSRYRITIRKKNGNEETRRRGRGDGTIQNEWGKKKFGRRSVEDQERHYRDRSSPADLNS